MAASVITLTSPVSAPTDVRTSANDPGTGARSTRTPGRAAARSSRRPTRPPRQGRPSARKPDRSRGQPDGYKGGTTDSRRRPAVLSVHRHHAPLAISRERQAGPMSSRVKSGKSRSTSSCDSDRTRTGRHDRSATGHRRDPWIPRPFDERRDDDRATLLVAHVEKESVIVGAVALDPRSCTRHREHAPRQFASP